MDFYPLQTNKGKTLCSNYEQNFVDTATKLAEKATGGALVFCYF